MDSNGPIAWDVNSAPASEPPSNYEAIESYDQPPHPAPPPPKPPAPRGAGYKLMLLIWKVEICILVFNLTTIKVVLFVKNLLIRKRHWFVTGMEIILPLLFAGLIVLTSTGSGPVPDRPPPFSHSPGMYEEKTNNKSDLPIDVTNLHKSSNCDSPRDRCTIGWAPEKGGAGNDVDAIRSAVEELKTIISPSISRSNLQKTAIISSHNFCCSNFTKIFKQICSTSNQKRAWKTKCHKAVLNGLRTSVSKPGLSLARAYPPFDKEARERIPTKLE